MSKRILSSRIPDNRLPTSPSYLFSLSFFYDSQRWMDGRAEQYLPSRVRSGGRGWRGCPSVLPRRIRRCGRACECFSFRCVSDSDSASRLVERHRYRSRCICARKNERTNVPREWIAGTARREAREAEATQAASLLWLHQDARLNAIATAEINQDWHRTVDALKDTKRICSSNFNVFEETF